MARENEEVPSAAKKSGKNNDGTTSVGCRSSDCIDRTDIAQVWAAVDVESVAVMRSTFGAFEAVARRLGKDIIEAWLVHLEVADRDSGVVEVADDR